MGVFCVHPVVSSSSWR